MMASSHIKSKSLGDLELELLPGSFLVSSLYFP